MRLSSASMRKLCWTFSNFLFLNRVLEIQKQLPYWLQMRDLSFNFHESSSSFISLFANPLNLPNWKFSLFKNHFAFILSRSNKINQSAVLHEKRITVIACEDEALRKTTFNLSLTHLTANVSVKRRAMTVTSEIYGTRCAYDFSSRLHWLMSDLSPPSKLWSWSSNLYEYLDLDQWLFFQPYSNHLKNLILEANRRFQENHWQGNALIVSPVSESSILCLHFQPERCSVCFWVFSR